MIELKCQDIVVLFKSNKNNQHIHFSDGPLSSTMLGVKDDGIRLEIQMLDKNNNKIKIIVFPYSELSEYYCENIQSYTNFNDG